MKNPPRFLSRSKPLLGHALEFMKDRRLLIERGQKEVGNVFAIKLGNKKAVCLIGPEYSSLFFKETDKSLNMDKPYAFLKAALGEITFLADHETYVNQRPMLYSPFTREKMHRYLEVMNRVVLNWLKSLPSKGEMNIIAEMNMLAQEIAGRAFVGDEFHDLAGQEFWRQYGIIGKSLDPILPPHWPLPKFIRRDRARKAMQKTLAPLLRERRANPQDFDDFLQDIIDTPFKDGSRANDEQVMNMILALLFAGHETTAGQAAWTVIQLLQNPAYADLVHAELTTSFPYGSQVDGKSLAQLKHLRWAIDETTRMKPSADLLLRLAESDLDIGDFQIPKGWVVLLATGAAQALEEVFSQADRYDPLRFGPDRAEHKCQRNSISSFGGGIHKCVGMNFALNEMMTITAHLMQQFELELLTPNPKSVLDMGASRPGRTLIRFRRRPIEELVSEETRIAAVAGGCPHLAALSDK